MKDCIGQEIKMGSIVLHSGGGGAGLYKCTVINLTQQRVKIEYGITQQQIAEGHGPWSAHVNPNHIVVIDDNFERLEWDAKQLKRKQA